ncbi:adhesion G-protein coupled receptor G6-like [Bolinopsis microptera]|uniref:adhesion G-protein coupled receptor G6-like n=1 Tax=Bolinopsis microptera TaxID=2820187 RepID=UPI00307A41A6
MSTKLPPPHDSILSYLTYVCGGMSCLALVLTLIALTWFKDIRRSPSNKIHIYLATTMLLAMLLFLGGAKHYDGMNEHLCKAIAIALHYLWLTMFMWTVVESYNLWLLFIRILQARSSRFIMKLAIMVFVIPGLIVGLTAGISYDSYTDDTVCLLRNSNENNIPMLYFAFYIPIGVSIIVNGGIFIAVVAKIFKKGRYQHFESKVQKIISQLKAVCTLSCVLGLAWVLGFLVFDHPANIAFHYLFTVCNTLQGVLIFIFHCAIKPDIYQKWLYFFCNIGKESKSTPSSRSNTPTKSRLDLFTGMFQKRSSIVTLSTTVTKLSLTKQLTRQRTDSKDSLTAGMQTAVALMKKASLEPLEEKESSVASPSLEPVKIVRKKMLSSRSSLGDQSGHNLTPPGDPVPSYFEFLEAQETNTNNPKRSTLPRSFAIAQTKIKDAVAAISPERHDRPKRKEVSTVATANKDKVIIAGKKIIRSQHMRVEEQSQQLAEIELNLEQRLFVLNSSSPDSSSYASGKRSASPLDLIRGRGKITPTPPPQSEVVKFKRKQTLKQTPKAEIDQLSTLKNGAKFKARLTPKTSLEIKPQTPITTKLSQLEEWIL